MTENKQIVIDGETLMDTRLPPQRFCIQTLLPQGLSILSGASKIGKSWMALDMCLHVAKGEPMWNQLTTSGMVLYLCLEDNYHRIQDRLLVGPCGPLCAAFTTRWGVDTTGRHWGTFLSHFRSSFECAKKSGRKRRARSGSRLGLNFPQCGQFGYFESGVVEAHF